MDLFEIRVQLLATQFSGLVGGIDVGLKHALKMLLLAMTLLGVCSFSSNDFYIQFSSVLRLVAFLFLFAQQSLDICKSIDVFFMFFFFSKFEAFQFNTRKHRKSHPHFGSLLCQTLFDINSNDFRSFKFIMHFSLWFTPHLLCLFIHLVQLLFLLIV